MQTITRKHAVARYRARRRAAGLTIAGIILAVLTIAVPAYGHHADIAADCESIVVTAWAGPDTAAMTNGAVGVFIDQVLVHTGSFDAGNGFSFAVDVPSLGLSDGRHVAVAVALGPWANGEPAGESRRSEFTTPCDPTTTTSTSSSTSTAPPTSVTTSIPSSTTSAMPPTTTSPTPTSTTTSLGGSPSTTTSLPSTSTTVVLIPPISLTAPTSTTDVVVQAEHPNPPPSELPLTGPADLVPAALLLLGLGGLFALKANEVSADV